MHCFPLVYLPVQGQTSLNKTFVYPPYYSYRNKHTQKQAATELNSHKDRVEMDSVVVPPLQKVLFPWVINTDISQVQNTGS